MDTLTHPNDLTGLFASTYAVPGGSGIFGDLSVHPFDPVAMLTQDATSTAPSTAPSAPVFSGPVSNPDGSPAGSVAGAVVDGAINGALGPFGALRQLFQSGGTTGGSVGNYVQGIAVSLAFLLLAVGLILLGAYVITKD